MKKNPASNDKPDGDRYIKDAEDRFFFDSTGGIYKPKSYKTETKSNQETKQSQRFWVTTIISTLTLFAVGIYAYYAALQWCEMRRAASAAQDAARFAHDAVIQARDQFRQDERPYIWITNTGIGTPEFTFDKNPKTGQDLTTGQITWTYHYTNYGKTPAYDLFSYKLISIGTNSPFRESYGFSKIKRGKGTPIPPNKDDFGTVVSDPGITPERFKQLLGIDNAIRIRVQMQYTDAYGGQYETEICLGRLVSGSIEYCEGSSIK
jgi:hypothetical protein